MEPPDGEGVRRQVGHCKDLPRDQLDLLVVKDTGGHHTVKLRDVKAETSARVSHEATHGADPPSFLKVAEIRI
jgi:hypothetical protein